MQIKLEALVHLKVY